MPANLLAFSVSSSLSASANTSDGKFTATLTEVMLDGIRATFASTLTVQPPLSDLNETELTCEGSTTGPVQDTLTIILTGECMYYNNYYYELALFCYFKCKLLYRDSHTHKGIQSYYNNCIQSRRKYYYYGISKK